MNKKEFYNYLKEQPFCGKCSKRTKIKELLINKLDGNFPHKENKNILLNFFQ